MRQSHSRINSAVVRAETEGLLEPHPPLKDYKTKLKASQPRNLLLITGLPDSLFARQRYPPRRAAVEAGPRRSPRPGLRRAGRWCGRAVDRLHPGLP
jgi:hypothetical protein